MLNIPSMHGGSNLWGETKRPLGEAAARTIAGGAAQPQVITDAETLKNCVQGELKTGQPLCSSKQGVGGGSGYKKVRADMA